MAQFNINTDAAVVLTNKLEKLHRSALPVAIRSTLNSVAFDVKQKTMLVEASVLFEQRNKNFFKSTSKVMMAKGFNVNAMKSIVGFVGGNKNQAVDDLEKQERGGTIGGRGFIPIDTSRVSKNHAKVVRKPNRLKNIRNIDTIKDKKLFHKTIRRVGVGGHILYKNTVFQIKTISRGNIKLLPLFNYEKGRTVKVAATHFMRKASLKSGKKMEMFYKIEAAKQIKRLMK